MSTIWRKRSLRGLAAAALILVLSLGPREPQYQGKSLTAWSRELPRPDARLLLEGRATDEATKALQQMGKQAVPFLVGMLRARDSVASLKCKDFFNELFASHSFIRLRFTYASELRVDALKAIFALGPAAKGAIPETKKLLDQGVETERVLIALAGIGPEAIPVLIQALTNRSQGVRAGAAGSLTWFREQGEVIVPALIGCLNDPDPQIRSHVIIPLAIFGRQARAALPRLLELAGGPDSAESGDAVRALVAIDCERAMQVFLQRLEFPDPAVRTRFAERLRYFGHRGRPAVPGLIKRLKDEDKTVRMGAAVALGEIGEDPDLVVPALMEQLRDEDLWVRTFAAVSVGPFGGEAKAAAPVILCLIEEQKTNESWRADLVKALQRVDPETAASKGLK